MFGGIGDRRLVLVLPLVLLLPCLVLLLTTGFNGLYGQDPYAYFDYAMGPLREAFPDPRRLPPFFWPPGYPLLVRLAAVVLGETPFAGQSVSLIAGALIPLFTALLASEIWIFADAPRRVPLLAGLLVALVGLLWQSSIVVMADTAGLASATFGMWAVARSGRLRAARAPGATAWLLAAAGAMAFAVLNRWAYALVAIPCAGYALIVLAKADRPASAIRDACVASVIVVLILSPVLGPTWEVLSDSASAEGPPSFAGNLVVHSWDPLNAFQKEFETVDGVQRYRLTNGLYYLLMPAHHHYLTPLLAAFLIPGIWAVVRRRSLAVRWLVVGWAAMVWLFLVGDPYQNPRFTLGYLPAVGIIAAVGLNQVMQCGPVVRRIVLGIAGIGLVAMAHGGWARSVNLVQRKQADIATVRWVEARVPVNAQLLTFAITLTFLHESRLQIHELFVLGADDLVRLVQEEQPTYLLIDVANVESQWGNRSPGRNFHVLQELGGMDSLDTHRRFTLFRINRGGL
jgi:4-amino-4-deoxy-L-arabinose transferase-like glycosyltransferase